MNPLSVFGIREISIHIASYLNNESKKLKLHM